MLVVPVGSYMTLTYGILSKQFSEEAVSHHGQGLLLESDLCRFKDFCKEHLILLAVY